MSGHINHFQTFKTTATVDIGGNGGLVKAAGIGNLHIRWKNGMKVNLSNVLYVSGLKATLISTSKLFTSKGLTTSFRHKGSIQLGGREVASVTKQPNRLYRLDGEFVPYGPLSAYLAQIAVPLSI